jgi:adenylate kinase
LGLNLVVIGPPGAGKGTQAEQIAMARGIPKISTGDILREAVQNDTEVGRQAQAIMARGELVNDDVMIGIVRERLDRSDAANGFVLDGFPRTVVQASALDEIVTDRGPLVVVEIVVPEAELVRRLTTRLVCEACGANADAQSTRTGTCQRCGGRLVQRSDDNEAVIRERLMVYQRQTRPLVEYYQASPTFRSVNGSQTPDRVAADLLSAVQSADGGVPKGVRG